MITDPPTTYAQTVDRLLADLSPEKRAALRDLPENELGMQYFGLAMDVRNEYGLWSGNSALLNSCAEVAGQTGEGWYFMDADGAADLIVRGAWQKLREEG